MVVEHKTPTLDARHDGLDAIPPSYTRRTGASTTIHGIDATDAIADEEYVHKAKMQQRTPPNGTKNNN